MKRNVQGFTLVELVVALAILGLVMTVIISAVISNTALNNRSEQVSQGAVAAQRVLDGVRSTDPAALPGSGSTAPSTVTVGGQPYSVVLTYCDPADYCTASARRIRADVRLSGKLIFSVDDVLTSVGSGLVSGGVTP